MKLEKILHIPHSSKYFPLTDMGNIVDIGEFNETITKLTDVFTNELFVTESNDIEPIIFEYSRCYCDVERFLDEDKERMSEKGMGFIYTKGINGLVFKDTTKTNRNEVLLKYEEHHNKLRKAIGKFNNKNITPLLIDCHSFNNESFINDGALNKIFPDICLGFNGDDESYEIILKTKKIFEDLSYVVSINNPYSGSMQYDDLKHYSIMIEINKKLYLMEDYLTKSPHFHKTYNDIQYVISNI